MTGWKIINLISKDSNNLDEVMRVQSNPFSKLIKFRPGGPIQLLDYVGFEYNEPGAILLEEKALNILRNIKEPICVITIVGSYRRGKSYFGNTLHGRHDGFRLGSSVKGCTKGIDMWDTPFMHEGKRVVILDCEGIDDPKQEVPWANKLFILCLAISSTFVFNINGVIGRDDVGKLCLMTNIASHIIPPNDSKFSPSLVVLLRDFQFDHPPDFVEYFLENLSTVDNDAAEGVKEFFGKFKVHSIPPPGVNQESMRDMSAIETERLCPAFTERVENAVNDILNDLPPKYIGNSTMTGATFVKFLEDCVKQMNDSENDMPLNIPSAYEVTTSYVSQKAQEICLKNYEDMMNSQIKDFLPIPWDDFDKVHIDTFENVSENFVKRIVGSAEQIQSFQEEFYEKILNLKKQFHQMNSEEMYKFNNEWAHKLWEGYVAIRLTDDDNLFTQHEYLEAINLFEQVYGIEAMPGEEAGQVLIDFKEHQYKDAIETLKRYGALRDKLADEISANQQIEKQYYDLAKSERQLQEEISNLKNEKEKIHEQLEGRIKNLEEGFRNQYPNDRDELHFLIRQHTMLLSEVNERYVEKIEKLEKKSKEKKKEKDDFWKTAGEVAETVVPIAIPIIINLVTKLFGVPVIPVAF